MNKKEILEIDKKYIWHPFTQQSDYEDYDPPVIVRGKNQFLYDVNGHKYYDTIASWWTSTIGHCNSKINKGIIKQLKLLDHVNFSGFTHPYAVELTREVVSLMPPGLSRVFFSDNGSTAVEAALKISFQYYKNKGIQGKTAFVKFKNAYHGDTIGAVSVGGIEGIHDVFNELQFKSYITEAPVCYQCRYRKSSYTFDAENTGCSFECFASIEKTIQENHEKIAAVIIEPLLQAAGKMSVYPKEYLQKLRCLTEKFNVLLIFDEVATGFGRVGTFFAMERACVTPDIITVSKGLTGGYLPLALTVCQESLYQSFHGMYNEGKTFLHGHSYTANPICCAAAIANLKEMRRLQLPQSKCSTIDYFQMKIRDFQQYDFIGDIRYIGLVGAVDIVKSRKSRHKFDDKERTGFKIYKESLKNNIVLRSLGDTVYWFLPFSMSIKDIDIIMERTLKSIRAVISDE